jgi:hypothetical protein
MFIHRGGGETANRAHCVIGHFQGVVLLDPGPGRPCFNGHMVIPFPLLALIPFNSHVLFQEIYFSHFSQQVLVLFPAFTP